jgi:RHS repeat-associated protein
MGEENNQLYYYHGDHLGSAQLVTDPEGKIYEQLEYTPYGELWVEHLKTTIETTPFRFTGKERDSETGLYYFGARYLNPQTSMWLSADPAMGEYIPQAPVNDEAKQHNKELPGMGGVFNYVNLHVYHYAGNNPVKLVDPDGRKSGFVTNEGAVAGAGHSGMWVELYDESGNTSGYAFFEVNPIDKNAFARHGGEPLAVWMAMLGGSSGGSSVGSSSSGAGGSSAGYTSGVIVNEVAIRVGVNEYRFNTREDMEKFIAKRWFKDETLTDRIRQTVFGTSASQDSLILDAAISEGDSFGRYDILSNNCVQYASKVLSAGGVNTSSQTVPNWSHDYIDRNNHDLIEN